MSITGVTIKGDQTTSWGAASKFTWTKGGQSYTAQIVKNCRKTVDGEKFNQPGSVGNTVNHVLFDDRNEAEVEVVYRSTEVYPARRDLATVGGVAGIVEKVEDTWESKGMRGCRVTVSKYDSVDYSTTVSSESSESSDSSAS
ncbi:MAG: hypothetical protein HZA88_00585 [Verrucomicrobia bacterium]|nr:hypothetical protein [Verrucomicrobiota bacterium]